MLLPSDADQKPNAPSVGLGYIAARAGVAERSIGWICKYVGLLIGNDHFPPPLPLYNVSTGERAAAITIRRRWAREAVDAWFDGLIPPQLAAIVADARQARDAELLDSRAQKIAA